MGPSGYSLAGGISGLYNEDATSGSRVMTYLFNPAELADAGDLKGDFLERHLDFWNGVITSQSKPIPTSTLSGWPNPTVGTLHLSQAVDFQLLDATGRILIQGFGNTVQLEGLPAGIYFLKTAEGPSLRVVRQ
jgi:hypothetical protein